MLGEMISMGKSGEREGEVNQSKNECWMFGGSTVWGDRINGMETITSHLNKLQNKYIFLNYGIPGYNSNSQLEYFIFLLKKRRLIPKCVLWLDGLNDGNSIWLSPITEAHDRTSHDDRPPSRVLDLSKTSNSISPHSIIDRDVEAMEKLLLLKKFDLITFNKISKIIRDEILKGKISLSGNEIFFKEATANQVNNFLLARSILNGLSGGKSNFYWFIQPNGELNENNPFLLKGHYTSNRYYTHKYYQKNLLIEASGLAIDLSSIDIDCKVCYVDESHYSPLFSKKIAIKILENLQ
jgi:hypothetical protein